jgi:hypothetical protein
MSNRPAEFVLVASPALERILSSPPLPGRHNPRDPRFEELENLIKKDDESERTELASRKKRGTVKSERIERHAAAMRARPNHKPRPGKHAAKHSDWSDGRSRVAQAENPEPPTHPPTLPPRVKSVLLTLCREYAISMETIRNGRDHHSDVVAARRKAILELRSMGFSMAQTGRYLGVHHTSVSHALRCSTSVLLKTYTCPAGELPVMDLSGEWAI